jgi:hypothetical protein
MTPRSCAAAVSLLGALWGCGASKEPTGSLNSISPDVAYSDVSFSVDINGDELRPVFSFDTMAGAAAAETGAYSVTLRSIAGDVPPVSLQGVQWTTPKLLKATIPADVPAGAYDVVVTDPRGQETVLPQAFTSLGPDEDAPVLTISPQPGSLIGALVTIKFVVTADDGHGFIDRLQVSVTPPSKDPPIVDCKDAPHARTCEIEYLPPTPAGENDVVTVEAKAVDSAGNPSTEEPWAFPLAPRPFVISMSPTIGPIGGGTAITLTGTAFVAGSKLLIDNVEIEGIFIGATEIRAVTPRHDPGSVMVQVQNGTARSAPRFFDFVAPPIVRTVCPPRGPVTGGTWIAVVGKYFREGQTTIKVGGAELGEVRFVSTGRMEGRVPAGYSAGAVDVTADDPIGGPGTVAGTFTYDDAEPTGTDPPDGGLDPTLCPGVQ